MMGQVCLFLFLACFICSTACVLEGFIDDPDDADDASRPHYGALPTRRKFEDADDQSPEQIASDLTRRYRGANPVRYSGDMNEIPQRLLMPSVHDASLWQVRVKASSSPFSSFVLLIYPLRLAENETLFSV
jgi:hypothetical protein